MRSMQWQLGMLGTVSAFAFRHRETKKILCQGGRSQDLPNTDFQPAVRHLKYKQQYTSSTVQYSTVRNFACAGLYIFDPETLHPGRPTLLCWFLQYRYGFHNQATSMAVSSPIQSSLIVIQFDCIDTKLVIANGGITLFEDIHVTALCIEDSNYQRVRHIWCCLLVNHIMNCLW